MHVRSWYRRARSAAIAASAALPAVGCATELRSGVLSGATSFVADATYGILAQILPLPLGDAPETADGGDPFANDVPLQM